MTIAGKIGACSLLITVCLGVMVTAVTAVSEFDSERDELVERTVTLMSNSPALAAGIYFRDALGLAKSLDRFLQPPQVVYAVLYDPRGDILLQQSRAGGITPDLPEFSFLRGNMSPTEAVQMTLIGSSPAGEPGIIHALLNRNSLIQLSLPVFSALNPLQDSHTLADFGAVLMQPHTAASLHVVGYLQIAISPRAILVSILPLAGSTALVCVLLGCILVYLTFMYARRITAPLSRIARAADEIAAGRLQSDLQVGGSGEVREIATILNGIIGGLSNYKTRMDVDHQLLSMKVEERTSQLTRRNDELNQAVLEVTKTKDRLRQMAYYDSLTALPNRRLFSEQLDLLLRLAKRNGETLALLFLDLDNFKRINDSLGHRAGDLLLREMASRLSGCVRGSDVVAHYVESGPRIDVSRLGGDEFTVVLNQLESAEAAAVVGQRLLETLSRPVVIEGHELVVTPSIGIAIAPADAEDVESLLKAADTAMYHAKAAGKNNCLFYHSDMDAADVERLELEADLRRAFEREEFTLHYQPQVDTRVGTVVGAEALVRWEHPVRGLIPPFKFIPLMEEMGLIGMLGEWVLGEACRQMKDFESKGLRLPKMSVNVSALQFTKDFIGQVKDILEKTGLAPSKLELELTEGVVMADASAVIGALRELKDLGVNLSIDDFGTGYSSLSYLSRFPLDELKIDRSFVVDIDKSDNDASLIIAIIGMARSMKLRLVAEGVETPEQYHFLTREGATVIQGYLFSKPVPAAELQPLLAPWHFMRQIQSMAEGVVREPGLAQGQ